MKTPIYLDYAATTPVDPRVAQKMCRFLTLDGEFGNAASRSHAYGWNADAAVEEARAQVAALIKADPKEIVWTSGATEADNLAIKGVGAFYQKKGRHIVTVKTEHKAVLDSCRALERLGHQPRTVDRQPRLGAAHAVVQALRACGDAALGAAGDDFFLPRQNARIVSEHVSSFMKWWALGCILVRRAVGVQ